MIVIVPIIVLLVAVNALYVAAEFAAVSVRRSRVQQMAEEGSGLARSLLPILQKPELLDRYIAACQIGITISSLVLGAYGQATIPGYLSPLLEDLGGFQEPAAQSISAVLVLFFLTGTQVIIGELVPKSLALQFPTRIALYTAIPMQWSLVVLRPFIWLLNGSAMTALRPFGAGHASHVHTHSPEEIELLIMQSGDGGMLNPDERERLHRALRLGNFTAGDVMVPRHKMVAFDVEMSVTDAISAISASPYTRIPVYRGSIDDVLGLLHTKDLAAYELEDSGQADLAGLIRPMVTIPETLSVDRVLVTLRERHSQQALVIDEHGGVAGLLTLEDILSEVFGSFDDEFKSDPAGLIVSLPGGRLRVPGSMSMANLSDVIKVNLPGSSHTVGGRVIETLGHLPVQGEELQADGVRVLVERVSRRAITTLVISPAPDDGTVNDAS